MIDRPHAAAAPGGGHDRDRLVRRVEELEDALRYALEVMVEAAHPDFLRHLRPAMERAARVLNAGARSGHEGSHGD